MKQKRNAQECTSSRSRWSIKGVAGYLLILLIVVFALKIFLFGSWERQRYQAELLRIRDSIEIGETRDSVATKLRGVGSVGRELQLKTLSTAKWQILTPHAFGAVNWVLWIDFEADRVVAVRVRIADSETVRPNGAPKDKRLDDSRSQETLPKGV